MFLFLAADVALHLLTRPSGSLSVEILRRTQNRLAALNNTTRWPEQPGFRHGLLDCSIRKKLGLARLNFQILRRNYASSLTESTKVR
jgi:hypothetical protein